MTNVTLFATASSVALLAATSLALGQVRFEAGYRFNDEAEVVRVESTPFRTEVDRGMRAQRTVVLFPFATNPDRGFADVFVAAGRGSGGGAEALTLGWSEVTFDDLVFESSGTEPIEVSFSVQYGGGVFPICCPDVTRGTVYREHKEFELDGDVRTGTFTATVDPLLDPPLAIERSGIIEGGFPAGGIVELTGFRVAVNTPVSLRIRTTRSIQAPATDDAWSVNFSFNGSPDLAFDDAVFDVPDGVTVQSGQIGIRDNQRVRCLADLERDGQLDAFDFLAFQNLFAAGDLTADFDGDGDLTIFDFLAFQNAFDAGC